MKVKTFYAILFGLFAFVSTLKSAEHVILLHGLCRTKGSMRSMADSLTAAGYDVTNVGYPSRTKSIRELTDEAISNPVRSVPGLQC